MPKDYDWSTILPQEIIDDIKKYTAEYRVEEYQEQLFDRWAFLQKLDEDEFDDIGTGGDPDRRKEFIDRCVEVYIDD